MTTKTKSILALVLVALVVAWIVFHFAWPILKIVLLVVGAITVAKWIFEALHDDGE